MECVFCIQNTIDYISRNVFSKCWREDSHPSIQAILGLFCFLWHSVLSNTGSNRRENMLTAGYIKQIFNISAHTGRAHLTYSVKGIWSMYLQMPPDIKQVNARCKQTPYVLLLINT